MYPLSFLHFAWAAFSGYGNVCFTFSLYVTALCKIYACIYIYIYIYMPTCVGDHALCMMDSRGYVSDPF